ncbi:hypothetical protein [Chryseobacterium sp. ERMR1:04]|uniref:hypothetical protein n=1 Tax=Chryseobacterium sp. ERMR1:04 TaxID=1705393 RepID=UPI0006C86DFC|nr:hypothetical protein [Chryseobacterium sp. ERMR1:04]
MTNKLILLYLFLFFVSCKKNEETKNYKDLNSTEYFSIATNLKNLKKIEKLKINDSLFKIKGQFSIYEIKGQINKNNKRIGWWEATDNNTKELVAKLEYKLIDKKEFVNQYILFENKKIDTLSSKFYSLKKKVNSVSYRFYIPNQLKKIRSEGKLNYRYSFQGKEYRHLESKAVKNKNIFECEISLPKNIDDNDFIIQGGFWEMFQLENGGIGANDIYVLDTIQGNTKK